MLQSLIDLAASCQGSGGNITINAAQVAFIEKHLDKVPGEPTGGGGLIVECKGLCAAVKALKQKAANEAAAKEAKEVPEDLETASPTRKKK